MAERVDLDELDAAYQDGTLAEHLNDIPDLVAEVRASRRARQELGRFTARAATSQQVEALQAILRAWDGGA